MADRRGDYIAPWKRAKKGRLPDPFAAGRLREKVVLKWPLAPEPVVEARDEALRAIEAYESAVQAVRSLGTDREREKAGNQARVAVAVRSGETAPRLERTDWEAEVVVRDVTHDETHRMAETAVANFARISKAHEGEWADNIMSGIAPARERARKALTVASDALREWRAAVDAGHRLSVDSGRFGPDWHEQGDPSIKPAVFMGGLANLVALVDSEDPVVTGEYLTCEEEMSPPLHTRQALNRKAELGVHWAEDLLARIEALEGFRVTHFTPPHIRGDYLRAAAKDGEMRGLLATKRLSQPKRD